MSKHDKASPISDGGEFDRPQCPVQDCLFILKTDSPDGYDDLEDHEWWCPTHGSVLTDAEGVQQRCPHCGELSDPLPEEYHGKYETPDGESYYAYSGTFMHPECAEEIIDALENGRKPVKLGDFA